MNLDLLLRENATSRTRGFFGASLHETPRDFWDAPWPQKKRYFRFLFSPALAADAAEETFGHLQDGRAAIA
jgi:hypothetical protein